MLSGADGLDACVLEFQARHAAPSPTQTSVDGLLDLDEVHAQYPRFSRYNIYHRLYRMRMKRLETGSDRST